MTENQNTEMVETTEVEAVEAEDQNVEGTTEPENLEPEGDLYDLNNPQITQRIQESVRDRILANIQSQQQQQQQQQVGVSGETQAEQGYQEYEQEDLSEGDIANIVRNQLEQYHQQKEQSQYQQQLTQQKNYYESILSDYDSNHLNRKTQGLSEEQQALIKLKYYEAINEEEAKSKGQVNPQVANTIITRHQSFLNNYLGKNNVTSKIKSGLDSNASKGTPTKEQPKVSSLSDALKIINGN